MSKSLVIVDSPAKIKTLKKYLGSKEFEVMASYGHLRDLIPKGGAVEPDNNFLMHYQVIDKNDLVLSYFSNATRDTINVIYIAQYMNEYPHIEVWISLLVL